MQSAPSTLAEVAENEAAGAVREIYAAIRRSTAAPLVPLIYRHLATFPDGLEWAWRIIGPFMDSGEMPARAERLREVVPAASSDLFGAGAFHRAGLDEEALQGIASVLDTYNRINPINIVAVTVLCGALAEPRPGGGSPVRAGAPPKSPRFAQLASLPPMADVAALGPELASLAVLLAGLGSGAGAAIMPSLYRHLANWPPFLRLVAEALGPRYHAGEIECAAAAVRTRASVEAAAALGRVDAAPSRGERLDAGSKRAIAGSLDAFVARIPEMIVVGTMLRRALPAA